MKFFIVVSYMFLAFVSVAPSYAQHEDVHHDEVLEAVRDGTILPLNEILIKVQEKIGGRVMNVRLEDGRDGLHGWVYHIRFFDGEGRLTDIHVDAGTASVLSVVAPQR